MNISAIKVSAMNIPTLKSYQVAVLGTIQSTQSVIVEVHTDEGLVGIGETDPALMFTGESQQTVMTMLKHHLGPAVLGMDPMRLEALHQRMEAVCVANPFPQTKPTPPGFYFWATPKPGVSASKMTRPTQFISRNYSTSITPILTFK